MGTEILITIQKLDKENIAEFIELVNLFEVVFEMENFSIPDTKHLQKFLDRDDFAAFVALNNENKVVGGLTIYVLEQYYSEKPLVYIYDLAVETNHQRKGIGKKLIREVYQFYKKKGFEEIFVQTDKIDDHAIEFYRKTNPSGEEQGVNFSYLLNE